VWPTGGLAKTQTLALQPTLPQPCESRVNTTPPVNESEIVNPSELMAIGDGFVGNNGILQDGVFALWRTDDVTNSFGSTERSYARHQGKANVVFCDGHIESPTLKFLFEDTSDAALAR
jgi:prepilin-type processing-associated H-X9-DG protein